MALNPALTVVIPCHNEEGNLARYPAELYPVLDSLGAAYEVILVDDGSTDGTAGVARALAASRAEKHDTKVVTLQLNRGLGGALQAGFDEARGEWVATLDADLTFLPAYLKDLLAARAPGTVLVSGSPYLRPGDMGEVPWARSLPSLMINALYRGVFGMTLTAYTPVFRLYRASFIKELALTAQGFEINAEIAARALLARRPVAEVPTPLLARTAGVSKLQRWRELRRHASLIVRLLSRR